MKVLFLDNDGVICLYHNFGSRFKKGKGKINSIEFPIPILERFDSFDRKAIKVLNRIIEKTDCEIVVSSDWKNWATVEELGIYYESQGLIKKPIDVTPNVNSLELGNVTWNKNFELEQTRCYEIKDWLEKHPEVTQWVAVDDMPLGTSLITKFDWSLKNFVWCPTIYEGIKQTGVEEKIINFLNE